MKIEKKIIDEIPVLKILGSFDLLGATQVQDEITEYIEKKQSIVLDLSTLNFLDSTALGIIVKSTFALNGLNAKLALIPNSRIADMFKFTYLTKFLNVFEDMDEAINFLKL